MKQQNKYEKLFDEFLDLIVEAIEYCLLEAGYDVYTGNYQGLIEYCRNKLKENKWDLGVMIHEYP